MLLFFTIIHPLVDACSVSVLVAGTLLETPFCIRQLEQE